MPNTYFSPEKDKMLLDKGVDPAMVYEQLQEIQTYKKSNASAEPLVTDSYASFGGNYQYESNPVTPFEEFINSYINIVYNTTPKGLVNFIPTVGLVVSKEDGGAAEFFDKWIKGSDKLFESYKLKSGATGNFIDDPSMVNFASGIGQGLGFIASMFALSELSGVDKYGKFAKYAVGTAAGSPTLQTMYFDEARDKGLDKKSAAIFSSILAPVSALSEYVGLEGLGNAMTKPLLKEVRKKALTAGIKEFVEKGASDAAMYEAASLTSKIYAQGFKEALGNVAYRGTRAAFAEGGQEFVQSYLEEGAKQLYDTYFSKDAEAKFGADVRGNFRSAVNDAIFGGILGFALGGSGSVYNPVFEESLFNVVDKASDKKVIATKLKKIVGKSFNNGKLNEQEAQYGDALIDKVVDFTSQQIPSTITNPIARFQAFRLTSLASDLQSQLSGSPLLQPDYINEQVELVSGALKSIANSDKPIADFNGLLKEINGIEQRYKNPTVETAEEGIGSEVKASGEGVAAADIDELSQVNPATTQDNTQAGVQTEQIIPDEGVNEGVNAVQQTEVGQGVQVDVQEYEAIYERNQEKLKKLRKSKLKKGETQESRDLTIANLEQQEAMLLEKINELRVTPDETVEEVRVEPVKPIKKLGTGANVYYETNKYRVNDDTQSGKYLLNVGDADSEVPLANVEFDDVNEAVYVAEKLNKSAPDGLLSGYHNIDKIISNLKSEYATKITSTESVDVGEPSRNGKEVGEGNEEKVAQKNKKEKPETLKRRALAQDAFDAEDFVLQYFVRGGKISKGILESMYGVKNNPEVTKKKVEPERKARISYISSKVKATKTDQLAEDIYNDIPEYLRDTIELSEVRNALEDVINTYKHPARMAERIISKYSEQAQEKEGEFETDEQSITEQEVEALEQQPEIQEAVEVTLDNLSDEQIDAFNSVISRFTKIWITRQTEKSVNQVVEGENGDIFRIVAISEQGDVVTIRDEAGKDYTVNLDMFSLYTTNKQWTPKKKKDENVPKVWRQEGSRTVDGVVYERQQNDVVDAYGKSEGDNLVKFADKVLIPFRWGIIDAGKIQPSHINGAKNPMFFIPEAQPKERTDEASQGSAEAIAANPRFAELSDSPIAYSGAPVINTRGELIQGNNRTAGVIKHYRNGSTQYRDQLKANISKYGLTEADLEAVENPVLVRVLNVADDQAINLGNYDVKDIESGGNRRVDPVPTAARISSEDKVRVMQILSDNESTLNQAIRDNFDQILKVLSPSYINEAQVSAMIGTGGPKKEAIADMEALVKEFLFAGNPIIRQQFESLSANIKTSLEKSIMPIFEVEAKKRILPEVHSAISLINEYQSSGMDDIDIWARQGNAFSLPPFDKYVPAEFELAKRMLDAKNQKSIISLFQSYAQLTKDKPADLIAPAKPGLSKSEAIKELLGVPFVQTNDIVDGVVDYDAIISAIDNFDFGEEAVFVEEVNNLLDNNLKQLVYEHRQKTTQDAVIEDGGEKGSAERELEAQIRAAEEVLVSAREAYDRKKAQLGRDILEEQPALFEEESNELFDTTADVSQDNINQILKPYKLDVQNAEAKLAELKTPERLEAARSADKLQTEITFTQSLVNDAIGIGDVEGMTDEQVDDYVNNIKDIPDEAKKSLAKRIRDKKIKGAFSAIDFGLTTTIYNGALEFMASQVEKGTKVGNAIAKTLKWIDDRMNGQKWDKGKFAKYLNDTNTMNVGGKEVETRRDDSVQTAEVVNGFYSDIEQRVLDEKKDSRKANEWLTVVGKGDEAIFTGVRDWLESRGDEQVSREDILQWMKDNRIEIREVVKGVKSGYEVERQKLFNKYNVTSVSNLMLVASDEEKQKLFSLQNDSDWLETKYSQYQLKGEKSDYKEVLITLPIAKSKQEYIVEQDYRLPNTFYAVNTKTGVKLKFGSYELAKSQAEKLSKEAQPDFDKQFKSSHFDEPNILVHLRMNTRIGTWEVKKGDKFIDGNGNLVVATENTTQSGKVLFLEEIQSDWAQKGRKEGFDLTEKEVKDKFDQADAALTSVQKKIDAKYGKDWDSRGDIEDVLSKEDYSEYQKAARERAKWGNRLGKEYKTGTPIAPFVMDTNAWVKLALKVAAKEAVKQGADKIAWTTGEQQNERYDLSKHVSKIYGKNNSDGTFSIVVVDKNNSSIFFSENADIKQIEDVVGKDMADKISKESGEYAYQGLELKIGGKGMRDFYGDADNKGIVGRVAEAVFGGGVTETTFGTREDVGDMITVKNTEDIKTYSKKGYEFMKGDRVIPKQDAYAIIEEGGSVLAVISPTSTQPSIDVTPKFAVELSRGIPLFGNMKNRVSMGYLENKGIIKKECE